MNNVFLSAHCHPERSEGSKKEGTHASCNLL
jgi:hypothetical protein